VQFVGGEALLHHQWGGCQTLAIFNPKVGSTNILHNWIYDGWLGFEVDHKWNILFLGKNGHGVRLSYYKKKCEQITNEQVLQLLNEL
jgi:hypothetical protein